MLSRGVCQVALGAIISSLVTRLRLLDDDQFGAANVKEGPAVLKEEVGR